MVHDNFSQGVKRVEGKTKRSGKGKNFEQAVQATRFVAHGYFTLCPVGQEIEWQSAWCLCAQIAQTQCPAHAAILPAQ